jgi:hypothetical protein
MKVIPLFLLALLATAGPGTASQSIYFQQVDGQSTYGPGQIWPAGGVNSELADDFNVIASIERVLVNGFIWGVVPDWRGVHVRFYEYQADGTPGALQQEYFLASGQAGLTLSNDGLIDATLSPPFNATGRHFIAVQPEVNDWYWWSSNTNAPKGQSFYFRDLAAGQTTWQKGDGRQFLNMNADLAFVFYGTTTGPGTISSLSAATAARSGFLEIFGANFGSDGTLMIGGVPAPISLWTSTRIVGYVPEASALGIVDVRVVNSGGASNAVPLNVTLRQANGRVNWVLRMEGMYSIVRPARAPDGTIYVVDVGFRLHALTPGGAVKWVARGAGNKGLSVGEDGTIYTGSESDVKAYNPDGTLKWEFVQDPRAFIMYGPNVGPDGNIYCVGVSGMGIFSLTPQGTLRWKTPEVYQRPITDYTEIEFGLNGSVWQLYFTANNHTRSVRLADGSQVFTVGRIGKPEVSPIDQTVHGGAMAITPNGANLWSFTFPIYTGVVSACEVGNDGTHYVVNRTLELYALDPSGREKWKANFNTGISTPNLDPMSSMLVFGRAATLNFPGFILGFDIAGRKTAWQIDLPTIDPHIYNDATGLYGFNQYVDTRTCFTPDGSTCYVVTAIATGGMTTDRCFLYSIVTGVAPPPPVPPPGASVLRSTAIDLSVKSRKTTFFTVNGQVTVRDASGVAVSGVTVNVRWIHPNVVLDKQSALTDSRGIARFSTSSIAGTYELVVENLSKTGATFDPANSVLSRTISTSGNGSGQGGLVPSLSATSDGLGSTTIHFGVPARARTVISIYNVTGRLVRTLVETEIEPGAHELSWDQRDDSGQRVPRGVYFVRMSSADGSLTQKVLVTR